VPISAGKIESQQDWSLPRASNRTFQITNNLFLSLTGAREYRAGRAGGLWGYAEVLWAPPDPKMVKE